VGSRAGARRTSRPSCARAEGPHLRLRLLQPVGHAHLAKHRRGGREVRPLLVRLPRPAVDLREPGVAVGDEGTHMARLPEREGFSVAGDALSVVELVTLDRDVAEQIEEGCLRAKLDARALDAGLGQSPGIVATA
jgi:hypothetical protein